MVRQCQIALFHGGTVTGDRVRSEDLYPIQEVPVAAQNQHLVVRKAQFPAEFRIGLRNIGIRRASVHEVLIRHKQRQAEDARGAHESDRQGHGHDLDTSAGGRCAHK